MFLIMILNRKTRQKSVGGYHHPFNGEVGRKRLHHTCFEEWESTIFHLHKKSVLSINKKITIKQLYSSNTPKTLLKFPIFLITACFFSSVVKICSKRDCQFLD